MHHSHPSFQPNHVALQVCPKDWSHQHELGLEAGLFANISVAGSFADFKFAPGGAALWLHALFGKKALCCIPPTTWNLAAYLSWLNTEQRDASFFGALAEEAAVIEVHAGETVLIPAGWLVAQGTVGDAFVIGSTFFNAGGIGGVLRVMEVEDCLGVPRLQAQEELLWHTARYLSRELSRYVGKTKLEACLADVRAARAIKAKEEADVREEEEKVVALGVGSDGGGIGIGGRGMLVHLGKRRRLSAGTTQGDSCDDKDKGKRHQMGVGNIPGGKGGDGAEGVLSGGTKAGDGKEAAAPKKLMLKLHPSTEQQKGNSTEAR
jgi:F-box/leucine-rich repeat protein 10/11